MSSPGSAAAVPGFAAAIGGRFYWPSVGGDGRVDIDLVERPIADVELVAGVLSGPAVRVSTRAVLVGVNHRGELVGRAVDPLSLRDGTLCFDPSTGGVRTRENRRARGAFNRHVAEANSFGMVNAYVHATRAADICNALLRDEGAAALPPIHVVVGAHSGSRLPGYCCGDGDRKRTDLRPMSGGHYRLSTITTGVPELVPVDPRGEMHLGPCRYRKPYVGWARYLRNAAHNPAIVYHEFGHHLCRHTADFRLNAQRRPERQRNGKTGIEEGVSDYFAAALLGTGSPYGWYNPIRAQQRDLDVTERHIADAKPTHAHAVGAVWAAAWWRCRVELVDRGFIEGPTDHDRVMVRALLAIGEVGRRGKRRTRRTREQLRSSDSTMIRAYVDAVDDVAGPRGVSAVTTIMDNHGLLADESLAVSAC
jgi:hypothetical protein